MARIAIVPEKLGVPFGNPRTPFSLGMAAEGSRMLFVSGMAGIDSSWQPVSSDIRAQTEQTFENICAILNSGGASLNDVVKLTIFLKSVKDYPAVNEVRARYFKAPYPASTCVEVSNFVLDGLLVEIDAVAVIGARAPTRHSC